MQYQPPNAFMGGSMLNLPRNGAFIQKGFYITEDPKTLKPLRHRLPLVQRHKEIDEEKEKHEQKVLLEGLRKMINKQKVGESDDRFTQHRPMY